MDKPSWTLHLRLQVSNILRVKNIRQKLVKGIQTCYADEHTELDKITKQISERNSHPVLQDTEPWTEEIWWRDAREVDQPENGKKTAEAVSSFPKVVDSAAHAAAAFCTRLGNFFLQKDWETSSMTASVPVVWTLLFLCMILLVPTAVFP